MILLYEDESHIRSCQAIRATWFETGNQRQIPTYGHHAKLLQPFLEENQHRLFLLFLPPYSPEKTLQRMGCAV